MTERDWRIFKEDNDIITKGGRVPYPIRKWDEAGLDLQLQDAIKRLGFKCPKPIQMQSIPIGLARKDMIALAPTG
jgi:ATP-dependent RNA helicase DDX23/PRP28